MKKIGLILLSVVISFSVLAAQFTEGKQYVKINPVSDQPQVLEFFSFYCPHCYDFEMVYHINKTIEDHLPAGVKLVKYHVDFLGPLGKNLTQAWAVAMMLGVEKKMMPAIFDALQVKQTLRNPADIRNLFIKEGVSATEYDSAINSFATKALVMRQEKAAQDLKVQGVPSVFVEGKYRVNIAGMNTKTTEGFAAEFSQVVNYLLTLK